MSNLILLSTVGGSHQPILSAIRAIAPEYVCSDDLDGSYVRMRETVVGLSTRFPGGRFVADYTGGTKTMTAALVCAALQSDEVELQLVSGARRDLVGVVDGTEQAVTASAARLRLERAMVPYLAAWKRYAYQEAAAGLDSVRIAVNAVDREHHNFVLVLSRALAHWDDFDHAGALRLIAPFAGAVAGRYPTMLPTLRLLSSEAAPRRHPARLFDLWLVNCLTFSPSATTRSSRMASIQCRNLHGNGWSGGRRIDSSRYWTTTRRRPA